ncbi:hypothetical protein Q4F19_01005 [Sphingomonas sp. BIUV-7]|uniref:Alginate export domain-containing protein n=2 Tax=Sphingomonas natans TaxID=3063330 RepID=A0ABT8Y3R3_9SPHN|nr:hypothetical protein [Sphingomonas sp. BIUV-7]MDO6412951.1 hypothetical protein [Sphingomonas sp. BIUV-7]
MLEGRRRPGVARPDLPDTIVQDNPGAVRPPPPDNFPTDELPIPDRWRLITALCADKNYVAVQVVCGPKTDPYHQNLLKGDRPLDPHKFPLPIHGEDWFLTLSGTSDTIVEPRSFPTPVSVQTTARPDSPDVFGKGSSLVLAQTFIASVGLVKGSTAFMPPHIEYRVTLAYNVNYVDVNERRVLDVRPSSPTHRTDRFLGVQEAFFDYHLRNVSDRYDFDSLRVGIQEFQADFRGFLFNDSALAIRLFGNRDNNRFQYNLAVFRRLEKDTNSGLNDLGQTPRDDYVFLANLYRQDLPVPGFTSQLIGVYNRNREGNGVEIDHNGFPVRPALLGDLRGHDYDAYYLGYNGDGHFDRINLTVSAYGVFGRDSHNFLTGERSRIRAFFAAAEPSIDFSWVRVRGAAMFASGDSDPYDKTENGYDAILENPIFAGADTSYWIRQTIPFAGGGRVIGVNGRNGILADLRSSKDQGQSNFINPGTVLAGAGADFDLTPTLRLSTNANHLWFQTTKVLQVLRSEGTIPKDIGWDLSAAAIWRPKMTQNIVVRLSAATLQAGKGFRDLFDQRSGSKAYYSVLGNVIVSF